MGLFNENEMVFFVDFYNNSIYSNPLGVPDLSDDKTKTVPNGTVFVLSG